MGMPSSSAKYIWDRVAFAQGLLQYRESIPERLQTLGSAQTHLVWFTGWQIVVTRAALHCVCFVCSLYDPTLNKRSLRLVCKLCVLSGIHLCLLTPCDFELYARLQSLAALFSCLTLTCASACIKLTYVIFVQLV